MKTITGRVVGFELNSQEPEKAAAFYSGVFGWEIAEPNWGYYEVARCAGGVGGGIAKGPEDFPHGVRIHIEVEDIEKALEAVCHRGAVVVREKMEFADFYLAYFADPTGNGVGLIQNKQQ